MQSRFALALMSAFVVSAPALADWVQVPAGGGEYTVKTKSFQDLRFREVVHQKYDYSCGSAAVATLLQYHYNKPYTEVDILKAMYMQGDKEKIHREGFSLLDMKNYLASIGLKSAGYRESLDKLADVGIPAIALINKRGYMHFVVIKGVTADRVLVGDPASGTHTYARKDFEETWNNILFVVTNHVDQAKGTFNDPKLWGKNRFLATSLPLQDADLARFALSITPTPNYY